MLCVVPLHTFFWSTQDNESSTVFVLLVWSTFSDVGADSPDQSRAVFQMFYVPLLVDSKSQGPMGESSRCSNINARR